jgi:predicted metal-dependent hydrolase
MSQHTISTSNGTFEYRLSRSARRRRTMEIHIRHEGIVEVHAPNSYPMATIESFLRRKAAWILQKLAMFNERRTLLQNKSSASAKECSYLGKNYAVRIQTTSARWGRILFDENGWTIEVPERIEEGSRMAYAREFMEKWFKSRALVFLKERVGHYATLMADHPGTVRIRSPRSLWGSCHPVKRVLHFNWKIVMAPVEVVDYLVVHELSHLKVADHSKRFWARVAQFCPQFKLHQVWLKQNGYQLKLPFGI